jgi:hypothetical protein
MPTDTAQHADQSPRTTRGLLVATAAITIPQLAFAAFIAIATWVETAGMTPSERADAWAGIGYYVAGVLAVPPLIASVLGGSAWAVRRRPLGVGLAIGSLIVAGIPVLFYVAWLLPV